MKRKGIGMALRRKMRTGKINFERVSLGSRYYVNAHQLFDKSTQ